MRSKLSTCLLRYYSSSCFVLYSFTRVNHQLIPMSNANSAAYSTRYATSKKLKSSHKLAPHTGRMRLCPRQRYRIVYCIVLYGIFWYGMVWYGMVLYDVVWYGMVWHGMVLYDVVWYGMVWYGMVLYGVVWYGMVWYGMYGMVWYGMVWYGRQPSNVFIFNTQLM